MNALLVKKINKIWLHKGSHKQNINIFANIIKLEALTTIQTTAHVRNFCPFYIDLYLDDAVLIGI